MLQFFQNSSEYNLLNWLCRPLSLLHSPPHLPLCTSSSLSYFCIMNEKLATAGKDVLVQIVKLSQKRGMEGDKGGWKEFLKVNDKQLGASISDPARRTPEVLRAFLDTFKKEEDLNYFAKVMKCHTNRELVKQQTNSEDAESPAQRLVRLTLEHPQYPSDYSFPSYEEGWITTKLRKKPKVMTSNNLLAIDCEMVLCEDGTEALVKLCVVDQHLEVKLHEFVSPNKAVADYRTQITGVSAEDLDGITCSLADIQKKLKKLFSRGAIVVGHSLSNDLKALKIDHPRVIDTSFVLKLGNDSTKRKPSLNDLCKFVLNYELRKKGAPHNCVDDACAAMKLVLAKMEHGFDEGVSVVQDDVSRNVSVESENLKLLIHRIPKDLPSEELSQIIPGDFTIEIKASKNGRGDRYSAVATFKTPQEALCTYEKLQGIEEKDSSGLPQKSISVQLKSGSTDIIRVRKMTFDNPDAKVSTKRPYPTEEVIPDSKKSKTEKTSEASQGVDHVKEIERLKDLVSQRDQEISSLHKIVAALTRKQGL